LALTLADRLALAALALDSSRRLAEVCVHLIEGVAVLAGRWSADEVLMHLAMLCREHRLQVRWVDATRVLAFVVNLEVGRNVSDEQFVDRTVSSGGLSIDRDGAIARRHGRAKPVPATVLVNLVSQDTILRDGARVAEP